MTRPAMERMLEQLDRHVQTPEGRQALLRRIRTPLSEEDCRRGIREGILTDPVMFRKVKRPMRDRGGHRVCDLQYDTDTRERSLVFKLGGLRTEISGSDLEQSFEDMIREYMLKTEQDETL